MNSSKIKLSNQVEAIKYFIQKMDIEMIDAFLDKNKTYQDFEKSIFIDKLQVAFEEFKERGDTFLISIEGRCNGCDISKTGFSFVGNVSRSHMDILFDTSNNQIDDLYECSRFKNNQPLIELKGIIEIDQDRDPF